MGPGVGARRVEFVSSDVLERIQECWLSNVVHDFSNPLFTARGYVRLLLEEREGPLTESHRRYLIVVLENISKLVALAQELNDFPAKQGFALEAFSFRDMLQQAVAKAASVLAERNLRLAHNLPNEKLATIGGREKLGQALHSFFSAAVQFSDPGGLVEVSAREDDQRIIVQLSSTGDPATAGSQPDLSRPCRLWRLHGGSTSINRSKEGRYSLVCELPVIRRTWNA
jgi:signal transduction histidine kinase